MHASTRLTSLLFFVLSLGFLACALPSPASSGSTELTTRTEYTHPVLAACVDLKANLNVATSAVSGCNTASDAVKVILDIVGHVNTCNRVVEAVHVAVDIKDKVKSQIAIELTACFTLIVKACFDLVVRFGLTLLLAVIVKVDICIKALILSIRVCVPDIVIRVNECLAGSVVVEMMHKLNLTVCAQVLGL